MQEEIAHGRTPQDAWNVAMPALVRATRAHCYNTIALRFYEAAEAIEDRTISRVLLRLCALFVLHCVKSDAADWLEDGSLDAAAIAQVRLQLDRELQAIRPDAVALVDAFGIPDGALASALGRADGRVYEALYETAQADPMNARQVFDGYWEHLKPLLRGDKPTLWQPAAAAAAPTARL